MLLITDISDRMLSIQQEMLCSSQIFHWSWTTDNIEYFKFLGNLAGIHSQNETHEAKGDWLLHKNTFSKKTLRKTRIITCFYCYSYETIIIMHTRRSRMSDGLHPIQTLYIMHNHVYAKLKCAYVRLCTTMIHTTLDILYINTYIYNILSLNRKFKSALLGYYFKMLMQFCCFPPNGEDKHKEKVKVYS